MPPRAAKSLLSGKAKKVALKEKREKDRVHAEKVAAWEKRKSEQDSSESVNQSINQSSLHGDSDHNDSESDNSQSDRENDSDDGVLIKRTFNTDSVNQSIKSSVNVAKPELSGSSAENRFRTLFARESKETIEAYKAESRQPVKRSYPLDGSFETPDCWKELIDFPHRPEWKSSDSAEQVQKREQAMFNDWLDSIYSKYVTVKQSVMSPISAQIVDRSRLNHFEHNLEVWRQLWRVCEQSDILAIVVDSRFPSINFPPTLYHYLTETVNKPTVLLLNKIDLVPKHVIDEWIEWFGKTYPKLTVIPYSSQPQTLTESNQSFDVTKKHKLTGVGGGMTVVKPYGAEQLLQACRDALDKHQLNNQSDQYKRLSELLSFEPTSINQIQATEPQTDQSVQPKQKNKRSNRKSNKQSINQSDDDDDEDEEETEIFATQFSSVLGRLDEENQSINQSSTQSTSQSSTQSSTQSTDQSANPSINQSREFLTIGMIGTPNAGKSSTINSLAGRKLVSVSKTPGHTKYLQTLFLNPSTRLCDCPGLVFPAVDMPRGVQVLSGQFPISQTRDPYAAVSILVQHTPLESILKLTPTPEDERDEWTYGQDASQWLWNAWSICEAMAYQKGYRNRNGVLDLYRAANWICRQALDGIITIYSIPTGSQTKSQTNNQSINQSNQSINQSNNQSKPTKGGKKSKRSRRQHRQGSSSEVSEDD